VNYTRPGNVDAACGLHPPLLHIPGCLSGRPSDFFSPAPRYWILSFFLSSLVVLKITQTGTASKTGQYAHLHTGEEGEEARVASSARINVKKTKATSRILAWIVSLKTSLYYFSFQCRLILFPCQAETRENFTGAYPNWRSIRWSAWWALCFCGLLSFEGYASSIWYNIDPVGVSCSLTLSVCL